MTAFGLYAILVREYELLLFRWSLPKANKPQTPQYSIKLPGIPSGQIWIGGLPPGLPTATFLGRRLGPLICAHSYGPVRNLNFPICLHYMVGLVSSLTSFWPHAWRRCAPVKFSDQHSGEYTCLRQNLFVLEQATAWLPLCSHSSGEHFCYCCVVYPPSKFSGTIMQTTHINISIWMSSLDRHTMCVMPGRIWILQYPWSSWAKEPIGQRGGWPQTELIPSIN